MGMPVGSDDQNDKQRWRLGAFLRSSRIGVRLTGAGGMLRAAIPVVVLALILGGFGLAFAAHAGHFSPTQTADGGATATASPSAAETSTAGDTTPTATTPGASATATASTHASAGSSAGSSASSSGAASSSMPQSAPTPTAFHIQSAYL